MSDLSQQRVTKNRTESKGTTHDGLLLGIVIGFAVWLPFMLFSTQFLSGLINSLFGALIVGSIAFALAALGIFTFRKRIARRVFGDVQASTDVFSNAISETIRALPDANRSAIAAAQAAREAVVLGSWFLARRAMLTVLLGIVGAVIAMLGTVLLLQQTEALKAQNTKLTEQTEHLRRQNEIMASEGKWELLWNAHYAVDSTSRLEAAVRLAHGGDILSGLNLAGPQPLTVKNLHDNQLPDLLRLEEAFTNVENFPEALFPSIVDSRLSHFRVFIDRIPNKDVRRLHIESSEISVGNAEFIIDSTFEKCLLRPQGKGTTFRDVNIHKCLIGGTPLGSGWVFRWSRIGALAIHSTGENGGPPLDPGTPASQRQYSIFFEASDIAGVYIQGPSLVGFRAAQIGTLLLEGAFKNADEADFVLSQLLAKDCSVETIAVGASVEKYGRLFFEEDALSTRLAREWIHRNTVTKHPPNTYEPSSSQ